MESVAQGWSVVQQTPNDPVQSAFLTELLNFADFAPVLFLSLIAGVIADRVNRKVWLFFLQSAACALGAGLAVVGYMGHLTPAIVIGFSFAEGIVWALTGPAWMTVFPSLVPRDELEIAMAANSMQFNLARLMGPMLAGIVIGTSSVNLAFAINAVTFVPVLFAVSQLPAHQPPPQKNKMGIMQDVTSGLRYVWRNRGTRRLAIMSSTFMFLSAPLQGLLAIFARQVLGGGSTLYGLMLGMIGLGSVVGAIAIGRIPSFYPRHHLIPLAMCIFCAFAILYSFSNTPVLTLPILFFCGVAWLFTLNPISTANQLLATDENRGRVVSVMLLCNQGAMPLGHLCAGALTHVFTPQNVVRSMLGLCLAAAIYFLLKREPAIDNASIKTVRSDSLMREIQEAITAQSHWPASNAESTRTLPE